MAYLIDKSELAGKAVQRVLREQNAQILALLGRWADDPADAIHRARQACKRARAVAHLLRPAAPYVATVENGFYRDIQRRVAYVRDAEAIVEAIDFLEVGVAEPRLVESVAMLRASLAARARRELVQSGSSLEQQVEAACQLLAAADRRLARLPLAGLRRRDLREGAARQWRRCARDCHALRPDSPPGDFHAWRRQVKYAAHQARLLARIDGPRAAADGRRLRALAALLGHAQDLEILDALLRRQPDALRIDDHVHRLRRLLASRLGELHSDALAAGHRLFGADGLNPARGATDG